MKRLVRLLLLVAVLSCAAFAQTQTYVFDLDPQQSRVAFTLDTVLHTVHGTFQLKSGSVHFDPATGAAGGLLVLDAVSGNSGSNSRDKRMHKDILESAKYPEITFAPQRVAGQFAVEGTSQLTLEGVMTLHGQPHPFSVSAPVEVHAGQASAELKFLVPYIQWGLKNPSMFVLRVSDKVELEVHAVGRVAAAAK